MRPVTWSSIAESGAAGMQAANVPVRCHGFSTGASGASAAAGMTRAEFAQASETRERIWSATGSQSQKEETMAGDAYCDGYEIGW